MMKARQRTPAQRDGANGARGLIIGDRLLLAAGQFCSG